MPRTEFVQNLPAILQNIQEGLHQRAKEFRDVNTISIDTKEDFYDFFTPREKEKPEIHGGFAMAHWAYDAEAEEQLQKDLKVSIRCIPEERQDEIGECPFTGKPSPRRVVFAKAY